MATRELPSRPNLAQYRKQAKELFRACKAGDPEALRRFREHHPPLRKEVSLADAQFVIAREHGFESWPRFAKSIQPADVWKLAEDAVVAGDVATLERLLRDHEDLRRRAAQSSWSGGLAPDYAAPDARSIIARNHQFESWEQYAAFAEVVKDRRSPAGRFEAAVDAIVAGDVATLQRLLRADPELIHARSLRKHRSTLFHYVGANGVEGFRQRTPKNAAHVAEVLLDAGAEIDAVAGMYGGSTTLELVATSIHPVLAGVQNALMEFLLERGASLRAGKTGDARSDLINACLANGRLQAAEFLARRAEGLDLEAAAGVGRLDLVT